VFRLSLCFAWQWQLMGSCQMSICQQALNIVVFNFRQDAGEGYLWSRWCWGKNYRGILIVFLKLVTVENNFVFERIMSGDLQRMAVDVKAVVPSLSAVFDLLLPLLLIIPWQGIKCENDRPIYIQCTSIERPRQQHQVLGYSPCHCHCHWAPLWHHRSPHRLFSFIFFL